MNVNIFKPSITKEVNVSDKGVYLCYSTSFLEIADGGSLVNSNCFPQNTNTKPSTSSRRMRGESQDPARTKLEICSHNTSKSL